MDVPLIAMSQAEAIEKVAAWEREKHADYGDTRAACLAGYKALAEGKSLIHLAAAIRNGGYHASGFPRLAIARADRERVCFEWGNNKTVAIYDAHAREHWGSIRGRRSESLVRSVEMGREPGVWEIVNGQRKWLKTLRGFAQVPMLPAEHRPAIGNLRDWFILWEVEQWVELPANLHPDRDPLLLEHVAGDLYAVLAEWDLTELERAIMAGAMRPLS